MTYNWDFVVSLIQLSTNQLSIYAMIEAWQTYSILEVDVEISSEGELNKSKEKVGRHDIKGTFKLKHHRVLNEITQTFYSE